ncbi:hypothetical protein [Nitrosovibrio sp. Nv6]|uniref:hypothetical protein n=1 Tax=Nitrosovibrio sp. Nv6 TaxID=1855340 RepID=UPI0008D6E787|nr:hypothetical protein [Nitrosovibrio sp. Nv6]SEO52732.1 hypothetical protein SAMN05216316_0419 [Nitrosovibrio sp. Nv6]
MRVTIIRDDGVVGVGGIFRPVDLSALPAGIRAVQWNGVSGHIEYDEAANTVLDSIADFQEFIHLWTAAEPQAIAPIPVGQSAAGQMKAAAIARINASYRAAVKAMTAGYPEDEINSWPKQETEARAWLQDSNAHTPWIDGAAAERGMSKAELVDRIIANAALFAPMHGQLTGKRQKLCDEIAALGNTPAQQQLDAIQW